MFAMMAFVSVPSCQEALPPILEAQQAAIVMNRGNCQGKDIAQAVIDIYPLFRPRPRQPH
jgi:hypothetical protein